MQGNQWAVCECHGKGVSEACDEAKGRAWERKRKREGTRRHGEMPPKVSSAPCLRTDWSTKGRVEGLDVNMKKEWRRVG